MKNMKPWKNNNNYNNEEVFNFFIKRYKLLLEEKELRQQLKNF